MLKNEIMQKMQNDLRQDEQGFILIVTMLILVVLTVLGLAGLDTSTFEVRVASNDRWNKVAFNLADGHVQASRKLIEETLERSKTTQDDPDGYGFANFTAFNTRKDNLPVAFAAGTFYNRVMGILDTQTELGAIPLLPDAQIIPPNGVSGSDTIELYILRREAVQMAGGGAEFGAGAAGAGVGSGGAGVAVVVDVDIDAYSGNNSHSTIEARFRKVLGSN